MPVWRRQIGEYTIIKLSAAHGGIGDCLSTRYTWYVVKRDGRRLTSQLSERKARAYIAKEKGSEHVSYISGET